MEPAGKVIVVTRSGTCVAVRIIGIHLGCVDWNRVLGKLVAISRRCVVYSSTSCVCVVDKVDDCVGL